MNTINPIEVITTGGECHLAHTVKFPASGSPESMVLVTWFDYGRRADRSISIYRKNILSITYLKK